MEDIGYTVFKKCTEREEEPKIKEEYRGITKMPNKTFY